MVNNLSAMRETPIQALVREDPLEKGMATHSGILAWRIPWTEEPGGLQSRGLHRVGHDSVTKQQLCSQIALKLLEGIRITDGLVNTVIAGPYLWSFDEIGLG